MGYNDLVLDAVQQGIAANASTDREMATVLWRSTSDNTATVSLSGSPLAIPVKCFANVNVEPGDRVGMVRFGSEWVIVGSFTAHGQTLSYASWSDYLNGDTNSSSTYQQISTGYNGNTDPEVTLTKHQDDTKLRLFIACSTYGVIGYANSGCDFAIHLARTGYSSTEHMARHYYSGALGQYIYAVAEHAKTGLSAGVYTCTAYWRVTSGQVAVGENGQLSLVVEEIT